MTSVTATPGLCHHQANWNDGEGQCLGSADMLMYLPADENIMLLHRVGFTAQMQNLRDQCHWPQNLLSHLL